MPQSWRRRPISIFVGKINKLHHFNGGDKLHGATKVAALVALELTDSCIHVGVPSLDSFKQAITIFDGARVAHSFHQRLRVNLNCLQNTMRLRINAIAKLSDNKEKRTSIVSPTFTVLTVCAEGWDCSDCDAMRAAVLALTAAEAALMAVIADAPIMIPPVSCIATASCCHPRFCSS